MAGLGTGFGVGDSQEESYEGVPAPIHKSSVRKILTTQVTWAKTPRLQCFRTTACSELSMIPDGPFCLLLGWDMVGRQSSKRKGHLMNTISLPFSQALQATANLIKFVTLRTPKSHRTALQCPPCSLNPLAVSPPFMPRVVSLATQSLLGGS